MYHILINIFSQIHVLIFDYPIRTNCRQMSSPYTNLNDLIMHYYWFSSNRNSETEINPSKFKERSYKITHITGYCHPSIFSELLSHNLWLVSKFFLHYSLIGLGAPVFHDLCPDSRFLIVMLNQRFHKREAKKVIFIYYC